MFIVLEGVDGTGKSSIRQRLYSALDPTRTFTHGKHAWFDITAARAIIHSRTHGGQDINNRDRVLRAYTTDKMMVAKKLTSPALAAGYHVIADRYAPSDLVYLNVLHDIPIDIALEKYCALDLPKADVLFLLDADLEVLYNRISNRKREYAPYGWPQRIDFWENRQYLKKLQTCYRQLPSDAYQHFAKKIVSIDTGATLDEAVAKALNFLT